MAAVSSPGLLSPLLPSPPLPCLLLFPSAGALSSSLAAALSPSLLLQPFASIHQAALPLRTPHGTVTLQDLSLRVAWDVDEVLTGDRGEDQLGWAVKGTLSPSCALSHPLSSLQLRRGEERRGEGRGGVGGSDWADGQLAVIDSALWLSTYRKTLHNVIKCTPFEFYDAPVAMVLAASTRDANPMAHFTQATQLASLPPSFQTAAFDPDIPKFYILFHDVGYDATLAKPVDATGMFRDMKTMLPPAACFLVTVNSLQPDKPEAAASTTATAAADTATAAADTRPRQPDIWLDHLTEPGGAGPWRRVFGTSEAKGSFYEKVLLKSGLPSRGCTLSGEDLLSIRNCMTRIITDGVVPAIEARVMTLYSSTAAQRRGIRDALRSWLGSSSSSGSLGSAQARTVIPGLVVPPTLAAEDASDIITVAFPFNSYENQMRQLGDTLCMLGDYDQASNIYRKLRDDLKPERNPGWYASVSEAISFCQILQAAYNPSAAIAILRDVDANIEAATSYYYKAALGAQSTYAGVPAAASGSDSSAASLLIKRLAIRLASRAALLCFDVIRLLYQYGAAAGVPFAVTNSRIRDLAQLLRRAGQSEGDGSLASSILTEQAALAHIHTRPPQLRKAAHLLSMSGTFYGAAGQPVHAVRCLSLALSAFGERGDWSMIEDHLLLSLAQKIGSLEDWGASCAYLCNVLAHGNRSKMSVAMQRGILRELFRSYISWMATQKGLTTADGWWTRAKDIVAPNLPLIDANTVAIASISNAESVSLCFAAIAQESIFDAVMSKSATKLWLEKLKDVITAPLPTQYGALSDDAMGAIISKLRSLRPQEDCFALGTGDTWLPLMTISEFSGFPGLWTESPLALPAPLTLYLQLQQGVSDGLFQGSLPGEGYPFSAAKWSADATIKKLVATCNASSSPAAPIASASIQSLFSWLTSPQACLEHVGNAEVAGTLQHLSATLPTQHQPIVSALAITALQHPLSTFLSYFVWHNMRGAETAAWSRLDMLNMKEARELDRVGSKCSEPFFTADHPGDWLRVCRELASAAEEELEVLQRSHRVAGGGMPLDIPAFGSVDAEADWTDTYEHSGYTDSTMPPYQGDVSTGTAAPVDHPSYHPADLVSRVMERYAGEPIFVSVSLVNPLDIELPLTAVRISGQWAAPAPETGGEMGSLTSWFSPSDSISPLVEVVENGFAVVPIDICLLPKESRVIRLVIRPLHTGTCYARQVRWRIAGLVPCVQELDIKGAPLDVKPPRPPRAIDRRLEWKINPAREWLGLAVRVEGAASSWYDGEVKTGVLTVTNAGALPIRTAYIRYTGKRRLYMAIEDPDIGLLPPAGLSGNVIKLPLREPLSFGEKAEFKILLRATVPGMATLRMAVYYGASEDYSSHAKQAGFLRVTRWCNKFRITPLLLVNSVCSPSPAMAGKYDLSLAMSNIALPIKQSSPQPQSTVETPPAAPFITIPSVEIVSKFWRSSLLSHQDFFPAAAVGTPDNGSHGADGIGFRQLRRAVYELSGREADSGCDMDPVRRHFLQLSQAEKLVDESLQQLQQAEHESRRAANANQSLAPTLQSIARDRKNKADGSNAAISHHPLGPIIPESPATFHICVAWRTKSFPARQGMVFLLCQRITTTAHQVTHGQSPRWLQLPDIPTPPIVSDDTQSRILLVSLHPPQEVKVTTLPYRLVLSVSLNIYCCPTASDDAQATVLFDPVRAGEMEIGTWLGPQPIKLVKIVPGARASVHMRLAITAVCETVTDLSQFIRVTDGNGQVYRATKGINPLRIKLDASTTTAAAAVRAPRQVTDPLDV